MQPEIPQLLLILKQACEKFGYSWQMVDKYANNLVKVCKDKECFYSSNSKPGSYPLNLNFAAQLVNDKAWCYKILKNKSYKIPLSNYFFLKKEHRELRGDNQEIADAFKFAENKYPVFVKPNRSSLGTLAEVVTNPKELKKHLKKIAQKDYIALISEKIDLPEYRIFAVDGQVEFVYQKTPAEIIGDGQTKISELIEQINENIKRERNKILKNSLFLKKQLKQQHLSFNCVLPADKTLQISGKNNISAGGQIKNYTEQVSTETQVWVKKLMSDLNLRICGIDVFVEKSINDPQGFIILEVNHNPSLLGIYQAGHEQKALEIWQKILKKYFGE